MTKELERVSIIEIPTAHIAVCEIRCQFPHIKIDELTQKTSLFLVSFD